MREERFATARRRVVGYVRVSEDERDDYQRLAQRQIDLITGWARENGAEIRDWHFDIGVDPTAPFGQRTGGVRLLDRVGQGDLSYVVVASLEALGKGDELAAAVSALARVAEGLGVVAVLPTRPADPDVRGQRRLKLEPTMPLEPQVGPEVLN
jgi:hypothetical protein